METILERQRHAHEEIERLEQGISDRLLAHPRTIRDRLQLDHEMAEMLEKIQLRSYNVRELYADVDSSRAREINHLSAASGLESFYSQLSSLKQHHQRYPDNTVEDLAAEYEVTLPDPNEPVDPEDRIAKMFSGEESYGRYFDLNSLHTEFVNLKRNRTINYARYLDIFDNFNDTAFPPYVKQDPKYGKYLSNLLDYLESFYRRTVPLDNHNQVLKELDAGFATEWQQRSTANSGAEGTTNADTTTEGIWCEICQKMYSKQTVYDGHLNSKKHKAGMNAASDGNGSTPPAKSSVTQNDAKDTIEDIARKEWMISKLGLKFNNVKVMTKSNVARKQTLTDKEWQAEQVSGSYLTLLPTTTSSKDKNGQDGDEGDVDEEEEEEKIYNPLKLPLGWDGKPIPFWLWRLHGLGVEYPCEICGNHIYMGRKAFDRHFLEWRHVHGLKCLGIVTGGSGLFDQITLIADAVSLWERMQTDARKSEKRRDENVEMEDESGNVMSEKVYNDLVAQGIL